MVAQLTLARFSFWTALVPILALLVGGMPRIGSAQNPYTEDGYNGAGIVRLVDWPRSLLEAAEAVPDADDVRDRIYQADLLPFIDTLALGYSYAIDADQPLMSFAIDWGRGTFGIVEGQRVHDALMPADVRMTAVELKASVHVNGRPATELFIVVDSMALAPRPDVYTFEVFGLPWDELFENTPADEARDYFEQGFTLADLEIARIEFHEFVAEEEAAEPRIVRRPRRSDRNPGVVILDGFHGGIHLGIAGRRGPRLPKDGPPRGDDIGRDRTGEPGVTRGGNRDSDAEAKPEADTPSDQTPSRTRTERDRSDDGPSARDDERTTKSEPKGSWPRGRSGGKDDDDDDDDEDESLLPAAAVGAAAVAALVVAGGTVGYYGNGKAPVGLTAGYVRPGGGFLLQVGVNPAVLEQSEHDTERFIARGVVFYDVFGSRIQPAVGLGAYVEELDGDTDITPDLSVGVVANFGKVLLQGGYDVTAGGLDFGIAFNFRHRRR